MLTCFQLQLTKTPLMERWDTWWSFCVILMSLICSPPRLLLTFQSSNGRTTQSTCSTLEHSFICCTHACSSFTWIKYTWTETTPTDWAWSGGCLSALSTHYCMMECSLRTKSWNISRTSGTSSIWATFIWASPICLYNDSATTSSTTGSSCWCW